MATAPSTSDIRLWTSVALDEQGYGTDARGEARLGVQLGRATSWLAWVTGRGYDQPQTDAFPMVKQALDQAVQMRVEQLVFALGADAVETAGDFDLVASFSAGNYSETRRDAGTPPVGQRRLNPWPALDDLLWLLLGLFPGETNDAVLDRYDYWRALLMGINTPAWQTVEVDWSRGMGLNEWPLGNVLGQVIGPIPEWNDSRIG